MNETDSQLVKSWEQCRFSANMAFAQGRLEQAEHFWWLALHDAEMLGNSELICACLDGLGDICTKQCRMSEAESLYKESLTRKISLLGDQHPIVGSANNRLASILLNQGKYRESESCLQSAIAIFKESLGTWCPEAQWSLKRLTTLMHFTGRHEEARELADCMQLPARDNGSDRHFTEHQSIAICEVLGEA